MQHLTSSYQRNVKTYWSLVEQCDLDAGRLAYPSYYEMVKRISNHYRFDFPRCVEAFAALSPNSDYLGNMRSLVSLLQGINEGREYTVSTYKACALRAETYLLGTVDFLATVKGPKIRAFRNCIMDPLECNEFVLDGHMIAIALGKPMTMTEAQLAMRKVGYHRLEDAYIGFARRSGLRLPELQAALWYCRKRVEGIKFTTQKDFWYDDARLLYPVADIRPYFNVGAPKKYLADEQTFV